MDFFVDVETPPLVHSTNKQAKSDNFHEEGEMRTQTVPVRWVGGSAILFALLLVFDPWVPAGVAGTDPTLGGSGTVATGSAGGAGAQGASSQLVRCDESLGTMAVVEDQTAPWYYTLSQHKLGSTVPVLRMMIQQSNCFVVVERGAAMRNVMQERDLSQSGEMRQDSNFGKGQLVAADYTMSPSITFSQKGTSGLGGLGGGLFGRVAGALAGGIKANESSTTLLLIDNRSGVQLAAAEGSAKNYDFSLFGGIFGGAGGGAAGGYTDTPEGKILTAAFMDSYNKLVHAARNYQAQTVKGGLGTGGKLGVQGGSTPASKEIQNK
jgi:curli biogenesis system outer membrane secretion channel CsgG